MRADLESVLENEYSVNETKTDDVLRDVNNMKSEIGIISYSKSNEKLIVKATDFCPITDGIACP